MCLQDFYERLAVFERVRVFGIGIKFHAVAFEERLLGGEFARRFVFTREFRVSILLASTSG